MPRPIASASADLTRETPLRIEKIEIESYRSLYNVTIEPRSFNVLVGPNNSGKSNLVEAIDFLADVHRYGVAVAIVRKGGFDNIAYRRVRRTKRPISFTVDAMLSKDEAQRGLAFRPDTELVVVNDPSWRPYYRLQHRFEITAQDARIGTGFIVSYEHLVISRVSSRGRATRELARVTRNAESLDFGQLPESERVQQVHTPTYPLGDPGFRKFAQANLRQNETVLNSLQFNALVDRFTSIIKATRIYQLAPIECRRPGVSTPDADIDIHGQNLPALIEYIREHHAEAWALIMDAMRAIIPGLTNVDTSFTHDRRLYLRFHEEGAGRPWTSEDVSDGTIQSLALFTALFDPRSQMVLIEEPENSVHPWIVRAFVDACRAVPSKQVLITSHSPALLSQLKPSEVSLAWRNDGRTFVEPLTTQDPQAEALWLKGEGNVYDLLNSGLIIEAVPGGLQ